MKSRIQKPAVNAGPGGHREVVKRPTERNRGQRPSVGRRSLAAPHPQIAAAVQPPRWSFPGASLLRTRQPIRLRAKRRSRPLVGRRLRGEATRIRRDTSPPSRLMTVINVVTDRQHSPRALAINTTPIFAVPRRTGTHSRRTCPRNTTALSSHSKAQLLKPSA